ncbi:MAG: PHP domain-containing protein, partial [Deltaproteobacteria bacterium]|nr:PHP domain-containing protein [Deltaproteobacteria bacterium]
MPDLIDLHCHTTASDGSLTPAELVRKARESGLKAVAVTDHDTVEGVGEALAEGGRLNFEVIPGIEISAEIPSGSMHILGYFIDHTSSPLLAVLRKLQDSRKTRNQ